MLVPTFVFALVIAVAGCSGATPVSPEPASPASETAASNPTSSNEAAAAEVEMKLDQPVQADGLEIEWRKLDDSRCPTGVQCIWEGQIVASFEVRRAGEEPVVFELTLRAGMETQPGRAFDREFRLLGVDPHPKDGQTPERGDYVARLEITES